MALEAFLKNQLQFILRYTLKYIVETKKCSPNNVNEGIVCSLEISMIYCDFIHIYKILLDSERIEIGCFQ